MYDRDKGLCLLGEGLRARSDDVAAGILARTMDAGPTLDADVEESFERVGTISTIAVARWFAGESADVAREVGREAWMIFGRLAAERAAPLNEVTKRCLRWWDAASEAVREIGVRLDVPEDIVQEALSMLQRSLHVTLVRVCESFEEVRRLADEQLEQRQKELAFMATHDGLTGLPNRTLMFDRAAQMMALSRRSQTPVAALFIDLDNFKTVNDTLGHDVGDELLRAVSARLDCAVRAIDALGRFGGDEFVVIAEGTSLAAGAELVAERLLEVLRQPFELGPDRIRVTVTSSIGVAVGHRASPAELLRDADIAMYRAKREGKDRYVVFASEMQDSVQNRMELEMDLRVALNNDEFFLVYQPTLDLRDMRPTGVEALIRWQHPVRGLVQPDDFIPLLEDTGMIVDVGRWVLRQACAQASKWRLAGYEIDMAVNVSAKQLDEDMFVTVVRDALADHDLDGEALTIEITETALMRNAQETAHRLGLIKDLGVRIAIDDFGTGYSSLAHLRQFPIDSLKIDRSFVSGLTSNLEGETLIHTLVQLGKALSIETLAEGIEHTDELSFLRSEHCDTGQGFLFARPQTADATEAFLRDWAPMTQPS